MARKARQRISYGAVYPYNPTIPLTNADTAPALIVLPLADSPAGHRLGVNGLAVDSERSILSEEFSQTSVWGPTTNPELDIREAGMELYAPGTSISTSRTMPPIFRILSPPQRIHQLSARRPSLQLPSAAKSKHILTG